MTGAGAFVLLTPHVIGYIPSRELAWGPVDQPRRFVHGGQRLEVMIIGEDALRKHLLLSRRLVLRNPWKTTTTEYPAGRICMGRVTQWVDYGAFIELEPGVVGLAHVSEVPCQVGTNDPIAFWPDDQVLVEVLAVDPDSHRISLSLRSVVVKRNEILHRRRHQSTEHGATIGARLEAQSDPLAHTMLPWYQPNSLIKNILLVDNDAAFGESTCQSLRYLGYTTTFAASFEEAQKLVCDPQYQLLLLDYDLPGGTGIDLARLAQQQNPQAQPVLLSAEAGPHLCQLDTPVPGLLCWRKPLRMQQFGQLLHTLAVGTCLLCHRMPTTPQVVSASISPAPLTGTILEALESLCIREVRQVIAATGAEAGAICGIIEGSQQVRLLAQYDPGPLLGRYNLQQLIHSPINDVIRRGETVRAADVADHPARFRYLVPWGTFRSFLGVPVRVDSGDARLGLLLFHRDRGYFSHEHEQQALLSAGYLGLAWERHAFLRTMLAAQQVSLTGRIYLSLIHESRGQTALLQAQTDQLTTQLLALRDHDISDYATLQKRDLPGIADRLQHTLDNLDKILQHQLNFTRPYEIRAFSLNKLVERTLEMLRFQAQVQNVWLDYDLDTELPTLHSEETLIQQIILNLTLNAVQQMHDAGTIGGTLLVTTRRAPEVSGLLQILFSDSGPGIHAVHQERLFQHGFTTRNGGTGQGLYISRAAAEALSGHLTLHESYVAYGSTFLLELPCSLPEVSDERSS